MAVTKDLIVLFFVIIGNRAVTVLAEKVHIPFDLTVERFSVNMVDIPVVAGDEAVPGAVLGNGFHLIPLAAAQGLQADPDVFLKTNGIA